MRLHLQGAERGQVEGQLDAPQGLPRVLGFMLAVGLLLWGFFALQFDLQRDEVLAVTDGHFGLPGGLQVAVFQRAGLLQAAHGVALQT